MELRGGRGGGGQVESDRGVVLARRLRLAARGPERAALLDQLEGVEAPPWPQIRAAIESLRDDLPTTPIEREFTDGT